MKTNNKNTLWSTVEKFTPYGPKPYKCTCCGHEQEESTNHINAFIAYCHGCSWKPSMGEGYPFNGRTYRRFVYIGEEL